MFSLHPNTLRAYRRRLTNLSSRNRSLLLGSLSADQFLDLHDTDYLLNKPSFALIQQLVARRASVPVCEVLDPRHERANQVSKRLRRIARTTRFIEEERGTEDLYVGWPFVRGMFAEGTAIHGPLLFFPVQLEQKGDQWHLTRRGDEAPFLNPTFALAYAHFNEMELPAEYIEKEFDELDKDALAFRTQLYEWLKASPFKINFNQELFLDLLKPFDKANLKTLQALEKTGELKLYPEAVLGIFPQAGSFLVPDYDALISPPSAPPEGGTACAPSSAKGRLAEAQAVPPSGGGGGLERFLRTPLPLDASQEGAVRAVKAGESLVVQGPPGTGKSQLIANLMADAAADGKRVLLVCQKRAALDVVYDRLRAVGMERFIALIHDFQDDRKALYAQLAGQIDAIDDYRKQNNGLDAVLIERDFDRECRQIDEGLAELQAFKDALFDTGECGVSAKELYLSSNSATETIPLDDVYTNLPLTEVDNFEQRLSHYLAYQERLGPDHLWRERVSFAQFSTTDQFLVDRAVNEVRAVANESDAIAREHLDQTLPPDLWDDWNESVWALNALLTLLAGENGPTLWAAVQFLRASPNHPANTVAEGELLRLADAWEEALSGVGPLSPSSLSSSFSLSSLISSALEARSSFISWNWWQLTNPGKEQLRQLAQQNSLTTSLEDLRVLQIRAQKSLTLEQLRPHTDPLLQLLPLPGAPETLRLIQEAREFTARVVDLPVLQQLPAEAWVSAGSFEKCLRAVMAQAETVAEAKADWEPYLTPLQIGRVWTDAEHTNQLRQSLRADFDLLLENDRLWAGFANVEQQVAERLTRKLISESAGRTDAVALFRNSLRLAWLNHLERQFPVLRAVSSLKMSQLEAGLQTGVQRKQQLSRDILLMYLRERTYRNLTFNRLNNVTTYRDLQHQTTKKRNVWPVRRLMSEFFDEVFRLVPCWMASPDSVSTIFPLQAGLFDLVIFDEASQCFAESGIPAMYRGKQVIVTGDSQQLRPSDLYRSRLDDETRASDDPDQTALEVESLLELAAQSLPQVSLTGHYRSRSLDLIQFSNEHFYQNKLSLLPDRQTLNERVPAIRYQLVPGRWENNRASDRQTSDRRASDRTNPIEAEAVLKLIGQLQTELPGRSIGVVTFNYPQQQLIQEMLETSPPTPLLVKERGDLPVKIDSGLASFSEESSTLNSPLSFTRRGAGAVRRVGEVFVKNIENVQGDECDVVIFSVGYAPDEQGRLAMQFGSLNQAGGANRLNVAVTRARERVYVVTSLRPEQLMVDGLANDGPRLLKAYLEYAQRVSAGEFRPQPRPVEGLRASGLLKNQLVQQHPNWQPELPIADLTIRDGNRYEGLVLTDDDQYYAQTVKESHALLPFALRDKGWPFERQWSREFWRGRT